MKFRILTVSAAALALAACGSADDASTEAEADTVEVPANTALEGIDETPVADPVVTTEEEPMTEPTPTTTEQEAIEQAGDDAAATAAAAADALGEE